MSKKVSILKSYQIFLSLILENKIAFLKLCFVLLLEIIVLSSSVALTIPLAEFLMNIDNNSYSKITNFVFKFLEIISIKPDLRYLLLIFIFSHFLRSLISTFVTYSILQIKYDLTYKLSKNLFSKSLNYEYKYYDRKDSGYLINTYTSIIQKVSSAFSDIALQIALSFKFFAFLTIPFLLNWKITLVTISLAAIFSLPFKYFNSLGYSWGKKNTDYDNKILIDLTETFQSLKLIYSFNLKEYFSKKFLNDLKGSIFFAKRKLITETAILNFFLPLGLLSASISFLIFFKQRSDLSEFAAIFYSLVSAVPILSSLLRGNFHIQNLIPSYDQYKKVLENTNYDVKLNINPKNYIFKTNIKFNNVNFSFEENKLILTNLNLEIPKNKISQLIGVSGKGKSTIIDLILGLRKPDSGNILFDDINFNDIDMVSFRKIIGFVPQEPFLYAGSIYSNFEIFKKNISEEKVNYLLKKCACEDFVNNFSEGIHYDVGERGKNLSGGQRQRISIARALISDPQILILDEPTSSLDVESEKLIIQTLQELKKYLTIILVSHNKNENLIVDQDIIL